ncbi:DNA cytosine methyltransferase [Natroniella acetigena]|uniref:DNA cytosine methyltransferase n=1 Tax=Natroniella acetigena TaxID=52004 RepID=UPI00200B4C83|nr:DNA cytosine methyltransferase [Natroniella acetigena]MCK8828544.1 DNA cytosine methyltransferase [Natroniella acetigena]
MTTNNNPKEEIDVVSLFAGCGGLDLGFRQAGFNVGWANEYNEKIKETYEYNHPGTKLDTRSIVDIESEEIPEADGIIGGPPCQSWSIAGSLGGIDDNRGKLFYEYIRVLRDKKPKFFLAENVPGITYKNNIDEFKEILNLMKSIGYKVEYKKINVADYGVCQTRKRVFIIGYREDLDLKFDFDKLESTAKKTLRETIGDLPEPVSAKDKNYTNGDQLEINGHEYYIGGFSSRYMSRNRRRGWDEQAYTVEASGRHAKIHPAAKPMVKVKRDKWEFQCNNYRRLSIRESARIQSFPDDFKFFYEKLNDGYKMVGNAVPVKMAKILAKQIKEDLSVVQADKERSKQIAI